MLHTVDKCTCLKNKAASSRNQSCVVNCGDDLGLVLVQIHVSAGPLPPPRFLKQPSSSCFDISQMSFHFIGISFSASAYYRKL